MEDDKPKKVVTKTTERANGFFKGSQGFKSIQGYKYKIKLNTSKVCKVNVIDTTAKSAREGGKLVDWVFRIDAPHKGAEFNHLNINSKYSGVVDPHLQLPPGGVTVAQGAAKVCQIVNKVALPIAVAVDVVRTGMAIKEDINKGTSRNTVETIASVAGGWSCGYGGAMGGAAIGTAILPGLGTIVGGIIGGISGGIGGSLGASYAVEAIGDQAGYDVEEKYCTLCGKKFLVRLCQEKCENEYCPKCTKKKKKECKKL